MRKLITLIAILVIATTMMAQNYDSDHKYSFWSNLSIGGSVSYNRAVFTNNAYNIGMDLRMTKRIHDNWRVRGIVDINGFIPNGFDRYGKLMAGMSLDFMPFYIFADYGANYNPDNLGHQKFGMAMDGGIGLGWDYFHLEAGVDRVNNGTYWQSNAFAKVGMDVPLGITETDRKNISIKKNIYNEYGELKEQNQLLKTEQQKILEANSKLEQTLTRANELCERLEQKLKDCEGNLEEQVLANMVVHFEYASSEIVPEEEDNIRRIAEIIKNGTDKYVISGYCSNNGGDVSNMVLSEDRAWAVTNELIRLNVPTNKIAKVVGYGKSSSNISSEQKVTITKYNQ